MAPRTRNIIRITAIVTALVLIALVLGTSRWSRFVAAKKAPESTTAERKILYWYDPMHPSYKSDKPGKAPDCGMDLVPMYDSQQAPEEAGLVRMAAQQQSALGVRLAAVEESNITRTLRTSGVVAADETRVAHVHVKTNGWVQSVYGDFVGQLVRKGQPLFTFYSPDLVATQQEYLIARRGQQSLAGSSYKEVAQSSQSLLDAARQRLKLWDVTDAQIAELDRSGTIAKAITVYSPVTGYITDRKAFPNAAVTSDMDVYTVADLSRVWITADVYESELPYVRPGETAQIELTALPGKTLSGRIAYVFPSLDPQTHTAKVRIDVANPGLLLKPNMLAEVSFQIAYGRHLSVPSEAVLNSGKSQTVFVARDGGKFEPREVTTGATVDGRTIVEFGLEKGEQVVASGNFLLDSDSRLKSGGAQ